MPKVAAAAPKKKAVQPKVAVVAPKSGSVQPKRCAVAHKRQSGSPATPKRLRQQSCEPLEESSSKARKASSEASESISVQILKLTGSTVATLSLQKSQLVQDVLDRVSAQVPSGDRIPHLTHETTQLYPHQTLSDAGVLDGAILNLTYEAKPLALRSVVRKLTHMQARATEIRLQTEIQQCEAAEGEARAKVTEASAKASALQAELRKLQKRVHEAEKELNQATIQVHTIKRSKASAANALDLAKQDKRMDYERILEQFNLVLVVDPSNITRTYRMCQIVPDMCDLHSAGEVCDDQLAGVAEAIVAATSVHLQVEVLKAIVSLSQPDNGPPKAGYARMLRILGHPSLTNHLRAVIAEPVPDQPDLSMPAEAERVGNSHPGLRDFLLSVRTEATFDTSKAGRMDIHRLIDGRIPESYRKLSHASEGYGHGRKLVVRKLLESECQRLAQLRAKRKEYQHLVQVLESNAGA